LQSLYPKTLQTSVFKAIAETSKRLIRIQFGEAVPMLASFLSRADLPSDPGLRKIAVSSYVSSLVPEAGPHSNLARTVLTFAMLLDAGTINDQPLPEDDFRSDAAPEEIAYDIGNWILHIRPGEGDLLCTHLGDVMSLMPDTTYEDVMTEQLGLIGRASAFERRQAIAMAHEAISLVAPPRYQQMRLIDGDGKSRFVLVRKDLEALSDGKAMDEELSEIYPER